MICGSGGSKSRLAKAGSDWGQVEVEASRREHSCGWYCKSCLHNWTYRNNSRSSMRIFPRRSPMHFGKLRRNLMKRVHCRRPLPHWNRRRRGRESIRRLGRSPIFLSSYATVGVSIYRLGSLVDSWKLGVKNTLLDKLHCGMRKRRLHHRCVQKDVVISIASAVRLISVHVIQISIVQRQVVSQWCGFNIWCVFSFACATRSVYACQATRSCAPPLYLTHSTA